MAEDFTQRHAIESWKHYAIDRTGYVPDESPYSDKSILRNLQEVRSTLVKAGLEKGVKMSEFMVQNLPQVDMIELDRNEASCAPASGCYWLRSRTPLPIPIRITSVTGIVANGDMPRFSYMKWDRFQYIPRARTNSMKKGRFYTIRYLKDKEPYLYAYGDRHLQLISVFGFFEDPAAAAAYPKCGEKDLQAFCNPLDVGFYTDAFMRDQIISLTWQKLLPVREPTLTDPLNDDTHGQPIGIETSR